MEREIPTGATTVTMMMRMPNEGSKGWQKDEPARWRRWSVQCPYCKQLVAETRGSSGLSQHMWWSEHCLQHQLWYQGGYSWREAGRRAAIVKAQRETEAAHEKGPRAPETAVLPARSGAHRMALEEERHPKEKDKKEKKRFFTQRGDSSLFPESKNACA